MLSHGGCIARGEDAAHVFALVHGVDAAAEIQVYAEMTGFPLIEIDKEKVKPWQHTDPHAPDHAVGATTVMAVKEGIWQRPNRAKRDRRGFRLSLDRLQAGPEPDTLPPGVGRGFQILNFHRK